MAHFTSSGFGQEEGSSQIGLNLELGRGVCQNKRSSSSYHGFTILQLHELQLQTLIYKYIEAGLPVPYNLVQPIWQSFSSSITGLNNGLGVVGPLCLDSRRGMENEPWRCRRTDGKKWRCSKEALPHQKYCERHIHRGRHRSRKLVDSCNSKTTTMANTSTSTNGGGGIGSTMTDLSISLHVNENNTRGFIFPRLDFQPN
ncbi:growth-regulating factor 10-like [Humulus lupulus]|uniref:growth-regulating factor 10-like n=1 Tax=Humulus lupulus TaxID=3486 RepID=UPI002B410875|nr:growth-regulating factor 10-like [Humulus lupulus]